MQDLSKVFGCEAPCILEIGFGSGYSLLEIAKAEPQKNFIALKCISPVLVRYSGCARNQLTNVRVYYADAVEYYRVVSQLILGGCANLFS